LAIASSSERLTLFSSTGNGVDSSLSAGADFAGMIDTEAFRLALGRIACGYDGGQIVDD
jgi:hypothetical protein